MPLPPPPDGTSAPLTPEGLLTLLTGPMRTQGATEPRAAMNSSGERQGEDVSSRGVSLREEQGREEPGAGRCQHLPGFGS